MVDVALDPRTLDVAQFCQVLFQIAGALRPKGEPLVFRGFPVILVLDFLPGPSLPTSFFYSLCADLFFTRYLGLKKSANELFTGFFGGAGAGAADFTCFLGSTLATF